MEAAADRVRRRPMDFSILLVFLLLLAIGSIMLISSSSIQAYAAYGDRFYFLKRQFMLIGLGLAAMAAVLLVDYRRHIGKLAAASYVLSIVALLLVIVGPISVEMNGATRWIGNESFTFQPSELAKLALILALAHMLSKAGGKGLADLGTKETLVVAAKAMAIIAPPIALIFMQPHKSCAILMLAVTAIMLFAAGMRLRAVAVLAGAAALVLGPIVMLSDYARNRIVAFFGDEGDKLGSLWQLNQSIIAIGSGGLFGKGLGGSVQKFAYLPEPHNDFIFAIVAEELGFVGVMIIIVLFAILIWKGARVAMKAPDQASGLIAAGVTGLIAVQFLINLCVVSGIFPVTGMPLPFFSYGGTSLILMMANVAMLLNISRYCR